MDQLSTKKTEQLAPIFRMLEDERPDWREISCRILVYLELEELSYALVGKRQNWQSIFQALEVRLNDDPVWIRVKHILDSIPEEGLELNESKSKLGLNPTTVAQTFNALERGGYPVQFDHLVREHGRTRKVFYRRTGKENSTASPSTVAKRKQ